MMETKSKVYFRGYAFGASGMPSTQFLSPTNDRGINSFMRATEKLTKLISSKKKHRNDLLYFQGLVGGLKDFLITNRKAKVVKNTFILKGGK